MGKTPTNTDVRFWRDPDLPGLEVRWSFYHEDAFRSHVHEEYSIGFIEQGRTTFDLEGGTYRGQAGDLILIGPNMAHCCNPDADSNMAYRMFYVDPSWLLSVAAEVFGPEADLPRFPAPVVDDRELIDHWRSLHQAIMDGADKLEKETLLVQGLAGVITRHAVPGREQASTGGEEMVDYIKRFLADNVAEKVSLDDLSVVSGLSRYHLLRVFQAATGLPPHAWQNQVRVDLGKKLLAEGLPVSRVAAETGFTDQSHFSRVFKQYTGATPRQYQDAERA